MVAGRRQMERLAELDSADFVRRAYRPRIWANLKPANQNSDAIYPVPPTTPRNPLIPQLVQKPIASTASAYRTSRLVHLGHAK